MEPTLEQHTPPIDKHWLERSDLTIHEAAFWMATGNDPLSHAERCGQDSDYEDYFHDHPGGSKTVEKGCEAILGAIRGDLIQTTEDVRSNNGALTTRTHIRKKDWVNWCRNNGYPELADLFESTNQGSSHTAVKNSGITKQEVISAFEGLHFSNVRWRKNLASPPNWLLSCRVQKGDKATSAIWNPVLIALELYEKQISLRKLNAVFVDLKDWTEEWQSASALLRI